MASDLTLVILAGGMATRLYPVTLDIPKSLIDINGTPFIQHQIDLIKSKGISNVVLCLGKFAKPIEDFLGNGSSNSVNIKYSYDGETLLGTGGALKKAFPFLSDPFMIMYGDSYLNIEYIDIMDYFNNFDKSGLMTVLKNENKWDKSNIVFRDGQIIKYDKVDDAEFEYIDYGFSILRKNAFLPYSEKDKFDLKDVFKGLISKNEMLGYEVHNRFYEIGSFSGIEETKEYLLKHKL
ncbi:MAG: sugar phosphate nucleotidyltransferase [Ignavibacteriota bacterium]|nr:sugar phosphate nucleotidyltransferase [Ignavibacteriota bacterium]